MENTFKQVPAVAENEVWLSMKEGSNLLGVSEAAVRKAIKAGKYRATMVNGNSGKQYRIALSSLPEQARAAFVSKKVLSDAALPVSQNTLRPPQSVTESEIQIRLMWAAMCLAAEKRIENGEVLTHALKKVAEEVNTSADAQFIEIRKVLGYVSPQTLYRWHRKWLACGRDAMHLDFFYKYKVAKKKSPAERTTLTKEHQHILESIALSPNKPALNTVLRLAREAFAKAGLAIPNERTARRHLERFRSENQLLWVSVRENMKRVNDTLVPYINRNPNNIELADVIEIDGWKTDFGVRSPITGREVRVIAVSSMDMRSTLRTGCDLMLTENTMGYASVIRQACLFFGKLFGLGDDYAVMPRTIMMDNSKSAHSSFIEGLMERFKSKGFKGQFYAKSYHGQSKTIEQGLHRRYAESARLLPTYRGNSPENKPARLLRGEKTARVLYEDIIGGYLPSLEEAHYALAEWLDRRHNEASYGKYLNGKTPVEIAAESVERVKAQADFTSRILKREELEFMMMAWHQVSLRNGMVSFRGRLYQHDALSHFRQGTKEFFIRYSIEDPRYVLVYRENGEFICKATLWCGEQGLHPVARLLGSEQDRAAVAQANETQRRIKAVAENLMRDQAASEIDNHRRKISEAKKAAALKLLKKTGTDDYADYDEKEESEYERLVRESQNARWGNEE